MVHIENKLQNSPCLNQTYCHWKLFVYVCKHPEGGALSVFVVKKNSKMSSLLPPAEGSTRQGTASFFSCIKAEIGEELNGTIQVR